MATGGVLAGMLGTTLVSWALSRLTGWSRVGLSLGVLAWVVLLALCFARSERRVVWEAACLGCLLASASARQEQSWKPKPPDGTGLNSH